MSSYSHIPLDLQWSFSASEVRALTLPNALTGLKFLFEPDTWTIVTPQRGGAPGTNGGRVDGKQQKDGNNTNTNEVLQYIWSFCGGMDCELILG